MNLRHLLVVAISAIFATTLSAEAVEVKIKDDVVQKEITPLGINISQACGVSPFQVRTDKAYFFENFEGSVYRQCHDGTLYEDGFLTKYVKEKQFKKYWGKKGEKNGHISVAVGADVMIVSGAHKGEKRKTVSIKLKEMELIQRGKKVMVPCLFYVFDKPIKLADGKEIPNTGMMLQNDKSKEYGRTGATIGHWMSSNIELRHDDLFPNGFGYSALMLDPTKKQMVLDKKTKEWVENRKQGYSYWKGGCGYGHLINHNGKWVFKIKAKSLDEGATLDIVSSVKRGPSVSVPITNKWTEHTVSIDITGQPSGGKKLPMLSFDVVAKNGKVLIDDFSCEKDIKYENPTIFNDEFVNALKKLKPGVIRHLMMGGTMEERLSPMQESIFSTNSIVGTASDISGARVKSWSIFDVYSLAELLNSEVWCSVPGTLYQEDVDLFMEFLGGPAGTKGGDMRIKFGHPKPWTESLKKIHVELGNECWNVMFGFLASGYNGPDYWEGIFKSMKSSPYYKDNIVLHAAGQNYSSGMSSRIMKNTPSADKYAIGPYQMHKLSKEDTDIYKTDLDFAKYAMIYPMKSCDVSMVKQMANSKKYGIELSVYEMSWHMTGGDVEYNKKKPKHPEVRKMVNNFVTSVPAAMAHFNHMLRLEKDFGMRTICHFTFRGNYFYVKLWGSVLNMSKENERFRPMGLVFSLINECMFGDIVATEHSANQPTFTGFGEYAGAKKVKLPGAKKATKVKSEAKMNTIYTYAFKDGKKRSLIIMNFDLESSQEVKISMGGTAKDVVSKRIAPKHWMDNNEYNMGNGEINVKIEEVKLAEFANGATITIPPASIQTIRWTE